MNKLQSNYLNLCIAIVTHGGPLKALVAHALGTDFVSICDDIFFANCSVSELRLRVLWEIEYLNSTEHLAVAWYTKSPLIRSHQLHNEWQPCF